MSKDSTFTALDATIGARVHAARKERGMTQSELAALFDCDQALISHLEKGTRTWRTKWIEIACQTFNLDLVEMFGGVKLSEEDARDLDLIRRHRHAKEMQAQALSAVKAKLKPKRGPKKSPVS